MQNSLQILPDKKTMSSVEISELTGKPHNDVLKDVRRILSEVGIDQGLFSQVYKAGNGQMQPCFKLPRRECDLVIAGYSAKYRLAIIDRWQELESAQPKLPVNYIEALQSLVEAEKEKQAALNKIEADKPKVDFAMAVRNMQGACPVGDFAKTIGLGRNRLFKLMRDDSILMSNNLPYQRYLDNECFIVNEQIPYTDSKGKTHPAFTTMVTGKGQVFLEKKYRAVVA
ncbi:MAG: phage antirepressor KilAC domain-containing protein [Methylobacter sp.]